MSTFFVVAYRQLRHSMLGKSRVKKAVIDFPFFSQANFNINTNTCPVLLLYTVDANPELAKRCPRDKHHHEHGASPLHHDWIASKTQDLPNWSMVQRGPLWLSIVDPASACA